MNEENPYAAPQAELDDVEYDAGPGGQIVRDGGTLLLWEGDRPPQRCVACNRPASESFPVKAFRQGAAGRQWIVVLLLVLAAGGLGGFLGVVLMKNEFRLVSSFAPIAVIGLIILVGRFFLQHNLVTFDFAACRFHKNQWRMYRAGMWALCIVYVLGRPLAREWGRFDFGEKLLPFFVLIYFPLFFLMWRSGLMVRPTRNKYQPYILKGFGKRFLNSFPESYENETTSTQTTSP